MDLEKRIITRRNFLGGIVALAPGISLAQSSRQAELDMAVKRELGKGPMYIEKFLYDPDGSLAIQAVVENVGGISDWYRQVIEKSDAVTIGQGYGPDKMSVAYFKESAFAPKRRITEKGLIFRVNPQETLQVTIGHENSHGKINKEGLPQLNLTYSDLETLDPVVRYFITESTACIEDIKKLRYGQFGKSRDTFLYVFSENYRQISELEQKIRLPDNAPSRLFLERQKKMNQEFFASYIGQN